MNTKFEDNTPLPELPVFKEMTESELKEEAKKFGTFAEDVTKGINDILKDGDK